MKSQDIRFCQQIIIGGIIGSDNKANLKEELNKRRALRVIVLLHRLISLMKGFIFITVDATLINRFADCQ